MPGDATKLGPFTGGLHNSSGSGEFIENEELYELTNMEVDTDGSLVNRPQINMFNVTGPGNTNGMSFIGTYLPSDGRKFIVAYLPAQNGVYLIDATTGAQFSTTTSSTIKSVCCIQYANKLWVVATTDSPGIGGYFDAPTSSTITWTTVAAMPRGESVAQYRERLWIACGLSATTNTSRFYFCAAGDPSSWTGTDFIDVAPGNGQKLVCLVRLGNDLVLFKEHSTHKFTYTTDPRKAELNEVDATIGVPAINCVVVYNNNTIYSLHDNAVYELFQYTYTRITTAINMIQDTDLDLMSKDQYGLTLHRDRLFVRYFKNLYVYSLRVKRWCNWVSDRKFSKVVVIPSATVGLDTAYTPSSSLAKPTEAYYFQDIRKTDDTGNSAAVAATAIGSSIYTSAGVRVTSYTIPVASAVAGDWVYLTYNTFWEVANQVPGVPAGFSLIASKFGGALGAGTEFYMWRKKWAAGETTYACTLGTARFVRASSFVIRGGHASDLVFGPDNIPRGASAAPSVVTAPGIPEVAAQSLVLTIHAENYGVAPAITPVMDGSVFWYGTPNVASTTLHEIAKTTYTNKQATNPVTFTRSADADTGRIVAFQMSIPPLIAASDPNIERFQGRITTKTYDFDVPQAFKVTFWWGIAIATSGKFVATLNIPNANKNMTYQEAFNKYGTWQAAINAKQQWSSNSNVTIPSTIFPSLGKYSRKFIKLLKKVRFRQIFFTIVFDVVTNGGIADASLRVYDLTVLLKQKETVVKETS